MDLTLLKNIGLTEGEIKVYSALVELGSAPIFKLMKLSKVSSSKVYLILDKLMQKGLVSFNIADGTKFFQITNPTSILDYVNHQKQELADFNRNFESLIPQILSKKGTFEQESAQVYTGVRGISAAFENLLKELKKGEEYCFFSINSNELRSKGMELFFKNYHQKRIEKGIKVRGIVSPAISPDFMKEVLNKNYSIKYYQLTLPTGIIIGKNRMLMPLWGETNVCYEIVSKRMTERYQMFFEQLWKAAKTKQQPIPHHNKLFKLPEN